MRCLCDHLLKRPNTYCTTHASHEIKRAFPFSTQYHSVKRHVRTAKAELFQLSPALVAKTAQSNSVRDSFVTKKCQHEPEVYITLVETRVFWTPAEVRGLGCEHRRPSYLHFVQRQFLCGSPTFTSATRSGGSKPSKDGNLNPNTQTAPWVVVLAANRIPPLTPGMGPPYSPDAQLKNAP